jgi:tetratricopeptide (TPR) repeat protein/CHAT domain-containing protein
MGNRQVETVPIEVEPQQIFEEQNHEAEMLFNKGLEAFQSGRYQESLEYFNLAIDIEQDNHATWYNKGICLSSLGRDEEAIAAFDRAINIEQDNYATWYNKGFCLGKLGRDEEAIVAYDRVINIKPDYDATWYNKGVSLGNLGRYEESLTAFDHAINIKSDDDMAWYNKALSLSNLKRDEEAISAYDCAINIKPDYDAAWGNKGLSLAKLGKYEEAIAAYDCAINIKPNYDAAWGNKGLSLAKLGRYEEAIAAYDYAINIKPDHDVVWGNKGVCLCDNLGRYEEAIYSFDRAISINKGNNWKAWVNRGIAASKSDGKGKELFGQYLPPEMQNPVLDRRGYEGKIACCQEGLKYVNQTTELEGWGRLHQSIGNAHYLHGQRQKDRFSFWRKAVISYETALETLTATPKLETAHLETLQDLIRVLLALDETEKAESLLRKGTDFLNERLATKTGRNQERFERQFRSRFNELTVSLYVQKGNLTEALELAEKDKNAFLRDGLLANTTEPSPTYPQMRDFLHQHNHTSIIYWHLSDNALTTFLLIPNSSEIKSLSIESNVAQINALKDWIASWQKDYNSYSGKAKKSEPEAANEPKKLAKDKNHPWRVQMEDRLGSLKNILRIADIEELLNESDCTQLLLIPHRDLHLFPLDSLFDRKYTISYLPSIQVGINLHQHSKPDYKHLLSIENPDSTIKLADGNEQSFPKLTAAEAESELICQMYAKFSQPTRKHKDETTLTEVTTQLTIDYPKPHTVFHFTGHGYYDFFNPLNSALALSQGDRFTLREIGNLDLRNYQLACLSACETAIADNQSITKEYIGIISAFMYSGVANVVSTLWTVESISSAILMVEFHRHYLAGETAATALVTAKNWLRNATSTELQDWYDKKIEELPDKHSLKSLLRRQRNKLSTMEPQPFKHPYYWAAFTISGL